MTWPTISPAVRFLHQPHRPGEAEGAIQGAADLARHAERPAVGVGNEHHLEIVAVGSLQEPFAGAVGRHLLDHHGRPADDEALGEPGALRLGDVAHRVERRGAAIVDLVPDLLGAKLGLARLEPGLLKRLADPVARQPDQIDALVLRLESGARHGNRVDMTGDRHRRCHEAAHVGKKARFFQHQTRVGGRTGRAPSRSLARRLFVVRPIIEAGRAEVAVGDGARQHRLDGLIVLGGEQNTVA